MENLAIAIVKAEAFWRRIGRIFAIIGSGVLILALILVVADVSGRFLFLKPITGGVESTGLMMGFIAFFGTAYALVMGSHVRVTILFSRFPSKLRLWADSLDCVIGLFFLGVLGCFGWVYFWDSFVANEALMAQVYLPAWVGKFSMPAGFFIFLIQYLLRLLCNLGRLTNKIKVAEGVTEEIVAE